MGKYTYSRSNVTMNTANDLMTLIAAASRRARIIEISVTGMGTTSAAGEVGVFRSTGGTTGGGALTGAKGSSDLPAAAGVVNTTWAAQPTLTGAPDGLARLGVNQNGANYRWVARPGEEIELRNSEQISIRPVVGSHAISMHVVVEEDY